jgi:hypothetical protein
LAAQPSLPISQLYQNLPRIAFCYFIFSLFPGYKNLPKDTKNKYAGFVFVSCIIVVAIFIFLAPDINRSSENQSEIVYYAKNLCPKIEPSAPLVRNTAVSIARDSSGSWNVNQLVDLYIWMKNNIGYVNDPSGPDYFASATETLTIKGGDCEDQAVLIASMIQSVGGSSQIVAIPECQHAFAAVYISETAEEFNKIVDDISSIYQTKYFRQINGEFSYIYDSKSGGYFLIVDPAGGQYLGDTFESCKGIPLTLVNC